MVERTGHNKRVSISAKMLNVFIDCQFCEDKTETKPASQVFFKREPNEILIRCSICNNLQYWSKNI